MIKQVCKNLISALAIIVGVHLILFIALQSPAFGDPIARDTENSDDRALLASTAQRLGLIDDINFAAFNLTLHAYTAGGAWAAHWDQLTGTLRPGMAADLVVLNGNIEGCAADEIGGLDVALTIAGGQITWRG